MSKKKNVNDTERLEEFSALLSQLSTKNLFLLDLIADELYEECKAVERSNDYCRRLSEPDNEKQLEKLRQEIILKLYKTGYVMTLEKVNTMLDIWLNWEGQQKERYLFGESIKNIIPYIVQLLVYCDEPFLDSVYNLVHRHVANLLNRERKE